MSKKYYWLKLDKGYLSSPKVKKLRRIAGGDTYTVIYLKMLLLSIENGGVVEYQGIEPTFEKELALILDEDDDNVKITTSYLESQGVLVCVDETTFLLPVAAERIGSESESRERVRAYRERKAVRSSMQLVLVKKLSHEQILLPDGNVRFIDNKRYGGNAEYVYELAECKCEICGESNTKKLVIHHNNGTSNDLEDLYLLCHSCHKRVESGKLKCDKHKRKNVTCNTEVTECYTDKDIDTEIEKETDSDVDHTKTKASYTQKPVKHKYGQYKNVLLSDVELEKLKQEFPDTWEEKIERLSEYIESKGVSYKSHLATIRMWARKAGEQAQQRPDQKPKFTPEHIQQAKEMGITPEELLELKKRLRE